MAEPAQLELVGERLVGEPPAVLRVVVLRVAVLRLVVLLLGRRGWRRWRVLRVWWLPG